LILAKLSDRWQKFIEIKWLLQKKDNLLQFIGNLQNLFNLLLLVKIIIFDGNLISALLASSLFCGLLMIILAKHENYAGNVNCNHKHTHLVTLW
jgi:hypothetical protein